MQHGRSTRLSPVVPGRSAGWFAGPRSTDSPTPRLTLARSCPGREPEGAMPQSIRCEELLFIPVGLQAWLIGCLVSGATPSSGHGAALGEMRVDGTEVGSFAVRHGLVFCRGECSPTPVGPRIPYEPAGRGRQRTVFETPLCPDPKGDRSQTVAVDADGMRLRLRDLAATGSGGAAKLHAVEITGWCICDHRTVRPPSSERSMPGPVPTLSGRWRTRPARLGPCREPRVRTPFSTEPTRHVNQPILENHPCPNR